MLCLFTGNRRSSAFSLDISYYVPTLANIANNGSKNVTYMKQNTGFKENKHLINQLINKLLYHTVRFELFPIQVTKKISIYSENIHPHRIVLAEHCSYEGRIMIFLPLACDLSDQKTSASMLALYMLITMSCFST